jgi:hypothetical protein
MARIQPSRPRSINIDDFDAPVRAAAALFVGLGAVAAGLVLVTSRRPELERYRRPAYCVGLLMILALLVVFTAPLALLVFGGAAD